MLAVTMARKTWGYFHSIQEAVDSAPGRLMGRTIGGLLPLATGITLALSPIRSSRTREHEPG